MQNLDARLKKLEATHQGGKVYIFRPSSIMPDDYSTSDLIKFPGVWSSVNGKIEPPVLTDKDYIIVDDIEALLNAKR